MTTEKEKNATGADLRTKEITKICDLLADQWDKFYPEWRFGQLMSNLLGWCWQQTKQDIFFIGDDEMLSLMKRYFTEIA